VTKSTSVHPDGRDVVVMVREANGSWRRPPDPVDDAPGGVPRFAAARDARRWLAADGSLALAGRQVLIARIVEMVLVEVVQKRVTRLVRSPGRAAEATE